MITLTVAEIIDLAQCAGLVLNSKFMPGDDELDTEILIGKCPPSGLLDEDNVTRLHYKWVACFTKYPYEGYFGLGKEIVPE